MPDLDTPRLRLHALTVDEAEVLGAGGLPSGRAYAPGYPLPDTLDGVGLYLRHRDRAYGFHFVVRKEDGRVIGEIGFVAPPRRGTVTIGYAIVPAARRQGYATEAIGALTAWSLVQPDVDHVRAQTLPDNEASIRALLHAGFEEDQPGAKVRRFVKVRRERLTE
ncbi:MAG TPA: GNAT family N-acetyltransferase [Gaiellaceae bacterium]|jgi:RimJ/RimL family protein N-acetyltransferase